MQTLEYLNTLRARCGIDPLKSWKGSKEQLAEAIAKVQSKIAHLDPVQEFIAKNGVKQCPPPKALQEQRRRSEEIDQIATRRVKGEAVTLPKPAKRVEPTAAAKRTNPDVVTLADIAREIGMNPKVARARMRRADVPASYLVGKHAYKPAHKKWVIDTLKTDKRS